MVQFFSAFGIIWVLLALTMGPTTATGQPFRNIEADLSPVAVASATWGDYDNDGDLDLIYSERSSSLSLLYRNDGLDVFTKTRYALPQGGRGGIAWDDYDGDGFLDLLIVGTQGAAVYHNNADGTFSNIDAGLPFITGSGSWADYDNDGDPDIVLSGPGGSTGEPEMNIYRNDGQGTFVDIEAALTPLSQSANAWGDYDNDGDLDLLVIGHSSNDEPTTILYRNEDGVFEVVDAGLQDVQYGDIAWGDYDGDGDLDLALMGQLYAHVALYTIKIYRNGDAEGSNQGVFNDLGLDVTLNGFGSLEWGDFDGDSDLDLLIISTRDDWMAYRNDTQDVFTKVDTELWDPAPAGFPMDGIWGDYDNDGDLDLFVGSQGSGSVYRNDRVSVPQAKHTSGSSLSSDTKSRTSNTPPAPPGGLQFEVGPLPMSAMLVWEATTDDHTPQEALTYNIRVGTTPGGIDVVAPMSIVGGDYDGRRMVSGPGNARQRTFYLVTNLDTSKTYYGSVQAIDNSFAASAFSEETDFRLPTRTATESEPAATQAIELKGAYPNPFYDVTTLAFTIPSAAEVTVEVYDLMGRVVLTYIAGEMQPKVPLVMSLEAGALAAGIYIYRLIAHGNRQSWAASGHLVIVR